MPERNWKKIKDVFHEALRRNAGEREAFLNKACAGNIDLRIEVESLLISLDEAKSFLEEPITEVRPRTGWQLQNGQTISHYKIVSPIGIGGMGEVYLAEDQKLHRKVALKILSEDVLTDKERLRRFQREAQAVSALNHPNILTIFEFDAEGGIHLFASEYVKGETLREKLIRDHLPIKEALDITIQIASALRAAHDAGVIHRDIKPENVMIRDDGYVKVLDFGLAKLTAKASTDSSANTWTQFVSNPGVIMGTVAYMSPEQVRASSLDSRSDIFSLGVVLYEMLAGGPPFSGESNTDVIAAIIQSDPPPLEKAAQPIAAEIVHIVRKMLRKDKKVRYQSMTDLLSDLHEVKDDMSFAEKLERSASPNDTEEIPETAATLFDSSSSPASAAEFSSESLIGRGGRWRLPAGLIAAIALVAAVGLAYWFSSAASKTQIDSIAVLPFENRSTEPDTDYLSDGLTESLIYRLSQLPNLKVSPTNSVFRYKGKETDLVNIARELGVNAVLSGRIVQRGDDLMISAELVDVRYNKLLWGEQYDRKTADLLATQREIARVIVDTLKVKVSRNETGLTKNYTQSNEAYQLYLKGRFYWNKRTNDGLKKSTEYYQQAIEKDPT
ncbi:MAG TPA: serine/threonine-protein kinase, partial [Pyrinomonadaceae bacterium]|nr:serine/threonine-protein kinase [Pyrinomonadaceae bacterium]